MFSPSRNSLAFEQSRTGFIIEHAKWIKGEFDRKGEHGLGDEILSLRFIGDQLDQRSVPIYELGDTLVALQRIVHKAYLFNKGNLKQATRLSREERMQLSLQISERRKSSDLYELIPFLADPLIQEILKSALKVGLETLAQYALQRVVSSKSSSGVQEVTSQTSNENRAPIIGAIYAETVHITNHISNIGGIDKVELLPATCLQMPRIELTKETQEYVRSIAGEMYSGAPTEIVGYVTRLFPNRMIADIRIAPSRYIKVYLSEDDFAFVRYNTGPEHYLRFRGTPLIRLGKNEETFDSFEADSVELEE